MWTGGRVGLVGAFLIEEEAMVTMANPAMVRMLDGTLAPET